MKRSVALFVCLVILGCSEEPIECDDDVAESVSVIETCRDANPCTTDRVTASGCTHERNPNGAKCFGFGDTNGTIGECFNGLCIVTKNDFADVMCVDASRECSGDEPYIVNRLDGSCLIEWCNFNSPGRSLRSKPAGAPCVRTLGNGTPEFAVGQCSPCAECF